jgi:hypothetical protein
MSYKGNSHVGIPSIYESQNQRNYAQSEVDEATRHSGKNVKGFMPSMFCSPHARHLSPAC